LNGNPEIYSKLEKICKYLADGIVDEFNKKSIPNRINRLGSMMSVHFCSHDVNNFEDAKKCDIPLFNRFFHHMLKNGVYLPPSAFETWFISAALTEEDIEATLLAVRKFD
jgi:glutamate-1-semialdehyde 2,1-aminomutase